MRLPPPIGSREAHARDYESFSAGTAMTLFECITLAATAAAALGVTKKELSRPKSYLNIHKRTSVGRRVACAVVLCCTF